MVLTSVVPDDQSDLFDKNLNFKEKISIPLDKIWNFSIKIIYLKLSCIIIHSCGKSFWLILI
jgi:hypothetical protein